MGHSAPRGATGQRPMRADAARNRAAIIRAAMVAFAEHGHEVDVREIARCAGVGMGTLYRHFPTKDELLDTILGEDFDAWIDNARRCAAEHDDPWEALTAFMEGALAQKACRRALLECFADSRDTETVTECRRELHPVVEELLARCHAAGVLRAGVGSEDIALLLASLGRTIQFTASTNPELWRRHLRISLDGLRACHDEPLPGDGAASGA
ncbi:TetR/AcrR family transcriptional regulator [Parasphingorhabdus pacifica]